MNTVAFYKTSIVSPLSTEVAFAKMAEVTHFAQWDPGVLRGKQVTGDRPGVGAEYNLIINATPQQLFRYRIDQFEPNKRYLMTAKTAVFTSIDEISVEPRGEGSLVTYGAELKLNGPLRLFDFGLRMVFGRIGDQAAAGMARFLEGSILSERQSHSLRGKT
jgi:Polyketide cyclase / dehydrase and lipid transport